MTDINLTPDAEKELKNVEAKPKKEKEKSEALLTPDVRANIATQLNELSISTDNMTDLQLISRLNQEVAKLNKQVIKAGAEDLQQKLNRYYKTKDPEGNAIDVTDKDFLNTLFELNIPAMYLHLFSNDDKNLIRTVKDKKGNDVLDAKRIWAKIRESKINPFKDQKDLFKLKR